MNYKQARQYIQLARKGRSLRDSESISISVRIPDSLCQALQGIVETEGVDNVSTMVRQLLCEAIEARAQSALK